MMQVNCSFALVAALVSGSSSTSLFSICSFNLCKSLVQSQFLHTVPVSMGSFAGSFVGSMVDPVSSHNSIAGSLVILPLLTPLQCSLAVTLFTVLFYVFSSLLSVFSSSILASFVPLLACLFSSSFAFFASQNVMASFAPFEFA